MIIKLLFYTFYADLTVRKITMRLCADMSVIDYKIVRVLYDGLCNEARGGRSVENA